MGDRGRSHHIAVAIAFGVITTLHIVLGELAPKSLALQRAEGVSLVVARPLEIYLTLFKPAIHLLNGLGNALLRIFGLRPAEGEASIHSVEELRLLVSASRQAGLVGQEAEEIVERAFAFDDFTARQVMVPRVDIVAVPVDASAEEALKVAVEHHHTRLPVYDGGLDNTIGVVHLTDLVAACQG